MLRLRIALQQFRVTASEARLERMHLRFELAQVRGRSAGVLLDRPGRVGQDLLLHESNAGTASQGDIPRVRRLESRRDAQQGGLPHPVRPDKTDAVPVRESERHVAENQALPEALRDRLD